MALFEGAANIEIDEDAQGRPYIENTATGTRVSLGDFVDIVGGLGSDSAPVAGTSYFEDVVSDSVSTPESRTDTETKTVNVPSDFPTVDAAIDEVSELRTPPGVTIDINIESGHTIGTQVSKTGEDFASTRLVSEDAVVPVDDSQLASGSVVFSFQDCRAPTLHETKFDLTGLTGVGFDLTNSTLYLTGAAGTSGAVNAEGTAGEPSGADGNNVNMEASRLIASFGTEPDFSGAGNRGVNTLVGENTVHAPGLNVDGCGGVGFDATKSSATVTSMSGQNCGYEGLRVRRGSTVRASSANLSGSGSSVGWAVRAWDGGTVVLDDATIDNAPDIGIRVTEGNVHANGISVTNPATKSVQAVGGFFESRDATLEEGSDGSIEANDGVTMNIAGTSVPNGTSETINVFGGSVVRAGRVTVSGGDLADGDVDLSSLNSIGAKGVVIG